MKRFVVAVTLLMAGCDGEGQGGRGFVDSSFLPHPATRSPTGSSSWPPGLRGSLTSSPSYAKSCALKGLATALAVTKRRTGPRDAGPRRYPPGRGRLAGEPFGALAARDPCRIARNRKPPHLQFHHHIGRKSLWTEAEYQALGAPKLSPSRKSAAPLARARHHRARRPLAYQWNSAGRGK